MVLDAPFSYCSVMIFMWPGVVPWHSVAPVPAPWHSVALVIRGRWWYIRWWCSRVGRHTWPISFIPVPSPTTGGTSSPFYFWGYRCRWPTLWSEKNLSAVFHCAITVFTRRYNIFVLCLFIILSLHRFSKAEVLLGLILYEHWCLNASLLPSNFLCRADGGWLVVVAAKPGGWGPWYNYVPINNLCAVTILPVQMVMARRWISHKHILVNIFFLKLIKILYCGPHLQFYYTWIEIQSFHLVHLAAMLGFYQFGIT